VVAVALGDLNVPSYDYLYTMTMSEFNIRFFSYYNKEKRDWEKIYELSKNIIGSSMMDSKSKNKVITDLRKAYIGSGKQVTITDFQKEVMRKANEEYLKRKQNG